MKTYEKDSMTWVFVDTNTMANTRVAANFNVGDAAPDDWMLVVASAGGGKQLYLQGRDRTLEDITATLDRLSLDDSAESLDDAKELIAHFAKALHLWPTRSLTA